MTEITMPRLSDSMQEATILTWLKASGDRVAVGEDLVELETDKATVSYASEVDGTLQIVAAEGTTLPVGSVIARVGDEVEDTEVPTEGAADARAASNGAVVPSSDLPAPTPLARRAAQAHSVNLESVRGTGPRGRVTRADVLAAAGIEPVPAWTPVAQPPASPPSSPAGAPEIATTAHPTRDWKLEEPTRLQQVIARRMAEARATIPEFEVETEVIMDEAIAVRARLKELASDDEVPPTVNDFVIKACAHALRDHPRVNASYDDGRFKLHERINVGFAVAREDALIVPVVQDTNAQTLGAIARETRRLAERVRSGEITPRELSGATFTVSNLGMYGMTAIRPVINPPHAAILGVGTLRQTLARVDGEIVDRCLMTVTLSGDHRILYGADAARFLADVRALLQNPLKLALA